MDKTIFYKTIFYKSLSGDRVISVEETTDQQYARDCFDGSDREWLDVLADSNGGSNPIFYIVSSGTPGYMRDTVNVYADKALALSAAKDEIDRDTEESAEQSGDDLCDLFPTR